MPKDAAMTKPLLDDLLTLTGEALAPVEGVLEAATAKVRETVSQDGKVSAARLEEHQFAAHALAWLATYVEALRQTRAWAVKLDREGRLGEMEQLLLQIAFGEYLWQIQGGIPMSQNETAKLIDMGLAPQDIGAMMQPAVMTLVAAGNTQAARMRLVELMQDNAGHATFGASGLVEELEMIREQFRRYADEKSCRTRMSGT